MKKSNAANRDTCRRCWQLGTGEKKEPDKIQYPDRQVLVRSPENLAAFVWGPPVIPEYSENLKMQCLARNHRTNGNKSQGKINQISLFTTHPPVFGDGFLCSLYKFHILARASKIEEISGKTWLVFIATKSDIGKKQKNTHTQRPPQQYTNALKAVAKNAAMLCHAKEDDQAMGKQLEVSKFSRDICGTNLTKHGFSKRLCAAAASGHNKQHTTSSDVNFFNTKFQTSKYGWKMCTTI